MGDNVGDEMEFVVFDETGNIVYRGRITTKGYRKSLESGELWVLHPETGRLLPLGDGVSFLSLDDRDDIVEAIVSDADGARLEAKDREPHDRREDHDERNEPEEDHGGDQRGPELAELDRTVASRQAAGGDGSYTAYLFEQGEAKIRKKLGEEAIELCLAEDDRELVSESADLLYHLSVLLAARGLSYTEVMEELRRRRDD